MNFSYEREAVIRSSRLNDATFVGPPFSIVGAADVNHDGNAAIVWHNSSTNETQIWFMDGEKVARRATVLGDDGRTPTFVGPPFSIVGTWAPRYTLPVPTGPGGIVVNPIIDLVTHKSEIDTELEIKGHGFTPNGTFTVTISNVPGKSTIHRAHSLDGEGKFTLNESFAIVTVGRDVQLPNIQVKAQDEDGSLCY